VTRIQKQIPPLPEQRAIAHILGALDDQIEALRRMNETLEGIARALFKAWFVDFEPVRAKMSGRWQRGQSLPGLPADLYDLFPDTLVPSELGEIPDDWKVGAIKECCIKIYNGGTPRREEPSYWFPATIPWLTSKEVRQCLIVETENFISSEGLAHSSAKWLPTFSTVVALYGATAGQVAFLGIPTTTNQAVCGLVPKPSFRFYNYFVLSLSSKKLANSARGSAQQNISKSIVESTLTLIPPIALVERFDQLCQPIFDKWIANLRQSRTLAALRDALLPELISGRLRLADAERFLQARGL
jgi:type I restriction enzyme S subunit